jgi:hypothetical protein
MVDNSNHISFLSAFLGPGKGGGGEAMKLWVLYWYPW